MMQRRSPQFVLRSVPFLLALVVAYALWEYRHTVFLRNFREVEPGRVYAGAYQEPIPLRRMLRQYAIKSVLCLRADDSTGDDQEEAIVQAAGVHFHRLPISNKLSSDEVNENLEKAATFLADPTNHPVYVHCYAGYHRTSVVIGMYRLKYCGWSLEDAEQELIQMGGTHNDTRWTLDSLRAYSQMLQASGQRASDSSGSR